MVAAGCGAAGAGGLHRKAAENQALEEVGNRGGLSGGNSGRIGQKLVQAVLEHVPGGGLDGLGAHDVGDHPLRAGRHLGRQIGISRGSHRLRGGCDHVHIRHHGNGRRALEGLLGILVGDGCAEGGVSVHRGGRGHGQIALLMVMRAKFAEVVDGAGPHRNRDGTGAVQHTVEFLDVVPVGVEFILLEEELLHRNSGGLQGLEDLCAGNPPGVFICHNDGLAAGEILIEQCGHAPEYALAKFEGLGVGCHLQGRCYSFFGSHWIAVLIYKYNLFSAIRDYAGGMAFAFVESG